ncbi:MAG: hypothetical protein LBJ59_05335, partial [Zoogloeaceae bacterium]|nr:hypothetical protein [Zoogloeaceae bacterium]
GLDRGIFLAQPENSFQDALGFNGLLCHTLTFPHVCRWLAPFSKKPKGARINLETAVDHYFFRIEVM